jgi:serine protease Do
VGFAIPISNARTIIEQLRQGKQPAYLGVNSQNIDAAKADGHDISVSSGAYVAKVFAGTPAADAGIQTGDVIVSIDGKAVSSAADLGNIVRQYRPGDKVDVVLDRDGKSMTVTARLGEAPSS